MTIEIPDHIDTLSARASTKQKKNIEHIECTMSDAEGLAERDKLPSPTGYRILVMIVPPKSVTDGGIHLTEHTIAVNQNASRVAYVIAMGPDAYKHDKFDQPWCKVGDCVLIDQYAGSKIGIDGGELRLINDDTVLANVKKEFAAEYVDIK